MEIVMHDDELMIDFTEQEAYQPKDFSPVPAGKYEVAVTDGELREVSSETSVNKGKPFVAIEFTVQSGPYEGRRVWSNVMLFPDKNGKMISAMGLLQAVNKVGKIRPSEFVNVVLNEVLVVSVRIKKDKTGQYDPKNEVSAYWPRSAGTGPAVTSGRSSRSGSLLPT